MKIHLLRLQQFLKEIQKILQYVACYILQNLYKKLKFSNTPNILQQYYHYAKLIWTVKYININILTYLQDRGELLRVNDYIQNVFIECKKIFHSSTSHIQVVINSS